MDYFNFIDKASFNDISYEISRLSKDSSADAIESLSLFLTHKAIDPIGKDIIPRLACRALVYKGSQGIEKMVSLIYEIEGYIYPNRIISSIWYARKGEFDSLNLGNVNIYPPLDMLLPSDSISAANNAFNDLIINGFNDKTKFASLIGFLYQQSNMSPDCSDLMACVSDIIAESSIKITKKQIDEFSALIKDNLKEEIYQKFLECNPVFIDPLAKRVINKHRLGDDLITDFVVQCLNGNYLLVEIEKPQDKIFNAKDDFSSSFSHAYGQVIDFIVWVDDNISYAQTKLPNISSPNGLLIIGRASELSPNRARKLEYFNKDSKRIKILTYDDILENAEILYNNIINEDEVF